jgi:hypothetical protein
LIGALGAWLTLYKRFRHNPYWKCHLPRYGTLFLNMCIIVTLLVVPLFGLVWWLVIEYKEYDYKKKHPIVG